MTTARIRSCLALLLLLTVAPPLWAQCTEEEAHGWASLTVVFKGIQMTGIPGSYAAVGAWTSMIPSDPCASIVQTEAWVWGNRPDVPVGITQNGRGTPVPAYQYRYGRVYGFQIGQSNHWYLNWQDTYFKWFFLGSPQTQIDLGDAPDPDRERCDRLGGTWDEVSGYCEIENCPILINMDRGGYSLTNAQDGVLFDLNAKGYRERVGWTQAESDVAFLALDRNGNGLIDDGTELFGTATLLASGLRARNGFRALAELDSNGDGRVDDSDEIYDRLVLWTDSNHDGVSQTEELSALRARGVSAIYLGYRETNRYDSNGNFFRFAGTALVVRRGVEHERTIWDVIFTGR